MKTTTWIMMMVVMQMELMWMILEVLSDQAEKMAKKADAWKEYKEAAMVDMMLQTLPKVAAEIAAPLSQAKKITMVSDGSGEVGAARITGEVLDIMVKVPTMVNKMTGVDVTNVSHRNKLRQKIKCIKNKKK